MIKIKSITDLITNSSTEVFIKYDKNDRTEFESLVNNILKLSGCTDFELRFDWDFNKECAEEVYDYEKENNFFDDENKSFQEFFKEIIDKGVEYDGDWGLAGVCTGVNINVIKGDSKVKSIVDKISKVKSCGDLDYYY